MYIEQSNIVHLYFLFDGSLLYTVTSLLFQSQATIMIKQVTDSNQDDTSIKKKVFEICSSLHSQKQKVTVRLVLSLLPDVKSTSTVHKYHKQWKEEIEAKQELLLKEHGLSKEFQTAFFHEITRFSSEAKLKYEDHNQELMEERAIAVTGLAEAESTVAILTDQVEQMRAEIMELNQQSKLIDSEHNSALEIQAASHTNKIETLEKQLKDSNVDKQALIELNELQRTSVAKMELQLESVPELKETITSLSNEVKQSGLTNDESQRLIAKLQQQVVGANETIDSTSQRLDVALSSQKQVEQDLLDTRTNLTESKVTLATQTEKLSSTTGLLKISENQITRIENDLDIQKDSRIKLEAKVEQYLQDNQSLTNLNNTLTEKVDLLNSDLQDKREVIRSLSDK